MPKGSGTEGLGLNFDSGGFYLMTEGQLLHLSASVFSSVKWA